ncbi:MAG: hypothetical protein ACJ8AH_27310 [Stellaceae bacterium]
MRQETVQTVSRLRQDVETRCFAFIKAHLCCRHRLSRLTPPLPCWRRWCPQPGDQREDVREHLSRHRYLDARNAQLRAEGCAKIYREKASGAQADRRELLKL